MIQQKRKKLNKGEERVRHLFLIKKGFLHIFWAYKRTFSSSHFVTLLFHPSFPAHIHIFKSFPLNPKSNNQIEKKIP